MQITEITFRILFLFLPGISAAIIIEKLTPSKKNYGVEFFIFSIFYGLFSYIVLELIYSIIRLLTNQDNVKMTFFESIFSSDVKINYLEVLYASIIASLLGILLSYLISTGYIYKLAARWNISNQTGSDSVWANLIKKREVSWVIVRDYAKNITYEGLIEQYSQCPENPELFLRNVKVFQSTTGKYIYDMDGIYLTLDPKNIIIEFRNFNIGKVEKKHVRRKKVSKAVNSIK